MLNTMKNLSISNFTVLCIALFIGQAQLIIKSNVQKLSIAKGDLLDLSSIPKTRHEFIEKEKSSHVSN